MGNRPTSITLYWTGEAVGANARLIPDRRTGRWLNAPEYRTCLRSMAEAVAMQTTTLRRPLAYRVDVTIRASLWCGKDTDGILKGAIDALVRGGLLANDNGNRVRHVRLLRSYHPKGYLDKITWHVDAADDELAEVAAEAEELAAREKAGWG